MTTITIILLIVTVPTAFFVGVMWERMQWNTFIDEEIFHIDHDADLES